MTFADNGDGTATLSGTPTATGGLPPLTFTAPNGVGTDATQTFTLTVNQAPAITSATSTTFTVGTAGTFTVTATGSPTPSADRDGHPAQRRDVRGQRRRHSHLSGTPTAGPAARYTFTITAPNGVGSAATQTFTLTVNQAPAITSAAIAPPSRWARRAASR